MHLEVSLFWFILWLLYMNKQQMCRARISTLISLALTREFLILKLYIENHICHTQWWYHPPPPQKKKQQQKKNNLLSFPTYFET